MQYVWQPDRIGNRLNFDCICLDIHLVLITYHITAALRKLHWLPIRERIQYKLCLLCLLVHKMFVGHVPDYIASRLTPASDIPSRSSLRLSSNCVTWSYQERVGRLVTALSLLPQPVLGIGCRPTRNSCVRLLHSRAN